MPELWRALVTSQQNDPNSGSHNPELIQSIKNFIKNIQPHIFTYRKTGARTTEVREVEI